MSALTPEEVFELVPGEAMDALVHRIALPAADDVRPCSTDDAEALGLARRLGLVAFRTLEADQDEAWGVRRKDGTRAILATGPTRALAICRAVLLGGPDPAP